MNAPQGVAIEPGGTSVLVVDGNPMGGIPSQVLRIDLARGTQSVVVPTSYGFGFPLGVVAESNGNFLVGDGMKGVLEFDVNGTPTTTYPRGGANPMKFPVGVALAPNGDIIVGDAAKFTGGISQIVRIHAGTQTIESSGNLLAVPIGVSVSSAGTIYVSDAGSLAGGSDVVMKLDALGNQTAIVTGPPLSKPTGIVVASSGKLLTANDGNSSILQVDPVTRGTSLISQFGFLVKPWGITLIPNAVPVANNQSVVVNEGTPPVPITVTASDADNGPRALTYALVTPPVNGLLTGTLPNVIYTPFNSNVASDSFQFKVNDGIADSNVATVSITINNVAPTVTITGAPASSPEGVAIALGSTVTDPGAGDTFTYAWSVSGGPFTDTLTDGITNTNGTQYNFTPSAAGNYVVSVAVTDLANATTTVSKQIIVTNVAPTSAISIVPPLATYFEGTAITLTGTATSPGTNVAFTYSWTVLKNGSAYTSGTTTSAAGVYTSTFPFTPDDNATYSVGLTITDSNGGSGIAAPFGITVANVAPGAVTLTPSAATLNEGDTTFTLSGTFTDPGVLDTHIVDINWGDGSTHTVLNLAANVLSYGPVPHLYDTNTGVPSVTDTITVTVTDKDGDFASNNTNVQINNVAPTVTINGSATGTEGVAINLTSTVTDPGPNDTFTYAWDVFKNGSVTGFVPTGTSATFGFTPDAVVTALGDTYAVQLVVTDAATASTTATPLTITVANVAPTVTITGAPASSPVGAAITLGTTVSDPGGAGDITAYAWTISGSVIGSPARTNASLTFTPATAGNYVVTVTVTDLANDTGAASVNIVISNAATTVTLGSSNTSSVFGEPVTFTATVSAVTSGAPTGTVTFIDGATPLSIGTISTVAGSQVATFTTSALSVATHNITAQYSGDTNFSPSSIAISQIVGQAATSAAVASSANPSVIGQAVTFTATITATAPGAGTPTGAVSFLDGVSTLGTGTLSGGTATFTTSALALGAHSITVVYGGDTDFTGSASSPALTQTVGQPNTSTALLSSLNPAGGGQSVTFTATVTAVAPGSGTPTGTVAFMDGAATLGTPALAAGTATFTTSALSVGTHDITAVYSGNTNYTISTSAVVDEVIDALAVPGITALSPSSALVESSALNVLVNGSNFTAGSAVNFNGLSRPTTFVSSSLLIGSLPASDLTAIGVFPITVTIPGPGGSTSAALNFTVENPPPVLVSINPGSATEGAPALAISVSGVNFVSTSTVSFGGTTIPTTFVSSKALMATIPAASLAVGTAGTISVTVVNPSPGGGASNSAPFTIATELLIDSGPTANPDPAMVGQVVQFSCGTNLSNSTYVWDFGDGTIDNSGNASVRHTYAAASAAGGYTVRVTATNGAQTRSGELSLVVNAVPTQPLTITKKLLSAKNPSSGRDRLAFSGTLILPAGTNSLGGTLVCSVGALSNTFTLNRRGSGRSGASTFLLKGKSVRGVLSSETVTFSATIKGNLLAVLTAAGLAPGVSGQVSVPLSIVFDGTTYAGTINLTVTAKNTTEKGK